MNWNKSGDFKIVRPITGTFKLEASKYVPLKFVELFPFLVYSDARASFSCPLYTYQGDCRRATAESGLFWGGKAINWNKSGDFKIIRNITGTFKLEASKYVPLKFVELFPFLVYSDARASFSCPLYTYQGDCRRATAESGLFWGGKAINWNKSGGCKIVRAITEPIIIIFVECDGPVLVVGWFNVILGMLCQFIYFCI